MKPEYLPCVEIHPKTPALSSVIWLHGLGADGHDFEPVVPELGMDAELATRFVFPHAPRIPVTVNGGMVMPAWYDIRGPDLGARHDKEGIQRSARQIELLIEREIERGVPPERIVLAGFSQGGAVTLHLGLRYPQKLCGLLALSTYLVEGETLEAEAHPSNSRTPIFQAHGDQDPMVPIQWGEQTRDRLLALGYPVAWSSYPMMHAICSQEIEDMGVWLNSVLGKPKARN